MRRNHVLPLAAIVAIVAALIVGFTVLGGQKSDDDGQLDLGSSITLDDGDANKPDIKDYGKAGSNKYPREDKSAANRKSVPSAESEDGEGEDNAASLEIRPLAEESLRSLEDAVIEDLELPLELMEGEEQFEATVRGIVTDAEGNPILGATVRALDSGNYDWTNFDRDAEDPQQALRSAQTNESRGVKGSTTTDATGRFVLTLSGAKDKQDETHLIKLNVTYEDWVPETTSDITLRKDKEPEEIQIQLAPGAIIFGNVFRENNSAPYEGIQVKLTPGLDVMREEAVGLRSSATIIASPGEVPSFGKDVITGPDGAFRFSSLRAGSYTVRASWPKTKDENGMGGLMETLSFTVHSTMNQEEEERADEQKVKVAKGEEKGPITLRLPEAAVINFRLTPNDSPEVRVKLEKKPQGGSRDFIRLSGLSFEGNGGDLVKPDAAGTYSVLGVREDHHKLTITAKGYMPKTVEIQPVEGRSLELGTIQLEMGGSIEGVVLSSSGGALRNEKVYLVKARNSFGVGGSGVVAFSGVSSGVSRLGAEHATTDASGQFKFEGLVPGKYRLEVEPTDGALTSHDFEITKSLETLRGVRITVAKGATVSGTVILPISDRGDKSSESIGSGMSFRMPDIVAVIPANELTAGTDENGVHTYQMPDRFKASSAKFRSQIGEDGAFEVKNVPPGEYIAVAVHVGKSKRSQKIIVSEGQAVTISIDMR